MSAIVSGDRYHLKAAALHGELASDSEITRPPSYQWCRNQVVLGRDRAWRNWPAFVEASKRAAMALP